MFGLYMSIILFNVVAFKTNKSLAAKQIAHIWTFTIAFQSSFDIYIDIKYHAYWYFEKAVDWNSLPAHLVLLPPINTMFLSWYPLHSPLLKQIRYFFYWEITLLIYEFITLLPEPWGYFYYGWWHLGYSAVLNPVLLIILLLYFKKFIKE